MKKLILSLSIIALLASCAKYEDGPVISFKSKDNRIKGKWNVIVIDGTETNESGFSMISYEFIPNDQDAPNFNDGTFKETYVYSHMPDTFTVTGTWKWLDNGDGISWTYEYEGEYYTTYRNLLKLTDSKMLMSPLDSHMSQTEMEKIED